MNSFLNMTGTRIRFPSGLTGIMAGIVLSAGLLHAAPAVLYRKPGRPAAEKEKKIPLNAVRTGVVRVVVSPARTDSVHPWNRRPGEPYVTTGLALGDGLILIQADDIRNSALIEVSRADSYKKERALPVLMDMETNLAVIRMEHPEFLKGLAPLQLAHDPVQGEEIIACRVDPLFRVYTETAKVLEYTISSDYGFTRLPAFLLSMRENYQPGDVLMKHGALAGFIAYQGQNGKFVAVPVSRIQVFRERALAAIEKSTPYRGFVVQGIELEDLVDPRLREYYGAGTMEGGAYVAAVLPGTPAGDVLRRGDVIWKLDGQNVDEKGLYRDPFLGLQKAELLFTRDVRGRYHLPGERIEVELVREKKPMKVIVDLHPYAGGSERIPWLLSEANPPYLIESGLVFLELSVPYLQTRFGKEWRTRALELTYLYDREKNYSARGQHDRVIVLSEVLPDPMNTGYQNFGGQVVTSVNGKKVEDLNELIRIMDGGREKQGTIVEVGLSDGRKIFLDPSLKAGNERIQKIYRLPQLSRLRR